MASRTVYTPCLRFSSRRVSRAPSLSQSQIAPFTLSRYLHKSQVCLQKPAPNDPDPKATLVPDSPALRQHLTLADRLVLKFRNYLPNTTETYVAFDATRDLYTECALQAAYVDGAPLTPSARFWYEGCGRTPSFTTWAHVTMLHMWMLTVRMRALDENRVGIWQQHFIDHFFYDSEDKMVKRHGVTRATERGNYIKDLYHQYRGMTAAYDEALIRGDAVMAAALWRNLFLGREEVDIELLATITSYVRRILSKLGQVDDQIVLQGRMTFGHPVEELKAVQEKSQWLEKEAKRAPKLSDRRLAEANAGA